MLSRQSGTVPLLRLTEASSTGNTTVAADDEFNTISSVVAKSAVAVDCQLDDDEMMEASCEAVVVQYWRVAAKIPLDQYLGWECEQNKVIFLLFFEYLTNTAKIFTWKQNGTNK